MLSSTVIREFGIARCSDGFIRTACTTCVRAISSASNDIAQPSTSGQDAVALGWIGKEVKPAAKRDPPLSWMYMRQGPDGVKRLMPWSECLIWGAVFGGIGYFAVPRIYNSRKRAEEERAAAKQREEELHQKRLTAIRILLSGKHWANDDAEAFEGMSPKQIVEFIKQNSINPEDPFEGMSPEEIDEFVRQTGVAP